MTNEEIIYARESATLAISVLKRFGEVTDPERQMPYVIVRLCNALEQARRDAAAAALAATERKATIDAIDIQLASAPLGLTDPVDTTRSTLNLAEIAARRLRSLEDLLVKASMASSGRDDDHDD